MPSLPVIQPDPFGQTLAAADQTLARRSLATLQLNLGKMCNLACHHCHVEAGPNRTEIMPRDVIDRVLAWIDRHQDALQLQTIDLTGGAPEMNPHFRYLVAQLRDRGLHVLDRCNLTILLEPGYEDLPAFLADHRVEVVASLPCYLEDNVDKQRGRGVFDGSIQALALLNRQGYGRGDGQLRLDLVYNPTGYALPPAQASLEAAYKAQLAERFGIYFDRLWTITNMPIKRFEHALRRDGKFDTYMNLLRESHNPANLDNVMCRDLVSVGYLGAVYDCDFNQMLQMAVEPSTTGPGDDERQVEQQAPRLWDFTPQELIGRRIRTAGHCFGCTAGAGSSCTGSLG